MGAGKIETENVSKTFMQGEKQTLALDDVNITVEEGSFTSLVGPSGCGKSTLLNIICGLEPPTSGSVRAYVADGSNAKMAYVFQTPRLMPWYKVMDNILVVHGSDEPKDDIRKRALKYLKMVGLEESIEKYPNQLSGGMQQRVGIARALSVEPDILLMDEPFSHLDAMTGQKARMDLLQIWKEVDVTIFFVTHDLTEAIFLSDRLLFMTCSPGRVYKTVEVRLPRPRSYDDEEFFKFTRKVKAEFASDATVVV